MKRSEMVKKISDWLLSNAPETYVGKDEMFRKIDASDLLSYLENHGMQPPPVPTLSWGEIVIRSENKWESSLEEEIKNDIL